MSMGQFDTGRQATVQIVSSDGGLLKPEILTEFSFKQDVNAITSRPLNGTKRTENLPDGWSGSFSYDRKGPTLDNYFVQQEADYVAGDRGADVYINQTIKEVDGSISQFRFTGVTLTQDDGGTYKQDDKVMQRVSWNATRRLKVN